MIGGYTEPKGSRTGLGALLLGVHDGDSGKLQYAGNVGTGFNEQTLHDLKQRLARLHASGSPFADAPSSRERPVGAPIVASPKCRSANGRSDGRIRHSVFQGLRDDKPPLGITREDAAPATSSESSESSDNQASAATRVTRKRESEHAEDFTSLPGKLRITHPERVIDPSTGVTKGDMVRHHASVASLMLPHLHERPVALLRAPRGVTGGSFFQKHIDNPRELPQVDRLDRSLDPDHDPMLALSSAEALVAIAQMNVVEIHTWNATTRAIDRPDRIVFDLDPGEGVGWPEVQQAVHLLHSFLKELELASFAKTSGGKGLHVVVPLIPQHDWDTVKQLAQAIVVHLADVIPQRFVAKSGAKNRVGRIYIDYLRNAFGATTIAAWSARARPGLGVSVPIAWNEVDGLRSGSHWSVATVGERIDVGNTPWSAYESSRQRLTHAMKRLGVQTPNDA